MAAPRTREALAIERDRLAADIMAMLLLRPKPADEAALQRFREHLIARYWRLSGRHAEQARIGGVA